MSSPCAMTLSDAERATICGPIAQARGLPGRAYTSSKWMALERDTVLGQTWMCIGFEHELGPRQAKPLELLGVPLVMVRDGAGATRVFHNVCRHRGLRLVSEPCDLRGVIRCPYHSWTYGYDGALRGAPHVGGPGVHECAGFERADKGLHEVRSHVWLGMVYINLSGDAPEFDTHLAPLIERWAPFIGAQGFTQLRVADDARMELDIAANWKLLVENYCESYHLPTIHPALNRHSRLEDHFSIMDDRIGAGQGSLTFDFTTRLGVCMPKFFGWPAAREKVAEYIAFYPNVLLGLQVDHFYAIVLKPLQSGRTVESLQMYFIGDEAVGETFEDERAAVLEAWREVFVEDVAVCEGMQAGRASPAFDGGVFSPIMDVATHHFHQWVARRTPRAPEED